MQQLKFNDQNYRQGLKQFLKTADNLKAVKKMIIFDPFEIEDNFETKYEFITYKRYKDIFNMILDNHEITYFNLKAYNNNNKLILDYIFDCYC